MVSSILCEPWRDRSIAKFDKNLIKLSPLQTQATLYVLYEHATGFSLFRVKEFEEIAALQNSVQKSVSSFNKFQSIVQLVSFAPFTNAQNALDNMNAISEGQITDDLSAFLENNLPKAKKKQVVQLGVADPKLGRGF